MRLIRGLNVWRTAVSSRNNGEDFGGPAWRLQRARSLILHAQVACREGDLDRALELFAAALEQVPLHRYLQWPGAREPVKSHIAQAFAILARVLPRLQ
jgi:hypothetical protein